MRECLEGVRLQFLWCCIDSCVYLRCILNRTVVVIMHLLKMLGARERDFLNSDQSKNTLTGSTMGMALNKLRSHSVHDTYPCHGLKSSDEYTAYDLVPPFVSKFSMGIGSEHILAVASEEGEIAILNTNKRRCEALLTKFAAHNNAIFDVCWAYDEHAFVTASGDATAALWDVSSCKKITDFLGHRSSVKTVSFKPQNKCLFATGSRDGSIMVWDTRMRQTERGCHADNILRNVHQISGPGNTPKQKKRLKSSNNESVTAVIFQDDNNLISAGVGDGLIKMWDLRKSYSAYKNDPMPKHTIPYPGKRVKKVGYASLILDSSCCRLFASCTDSTIYEFNCISYSYKPIATYYGHLNSTYFVKSTLSPCDRYLLSGSSDNNAYIWKVGTSGKAAYQLTGHSAEVTSVDWCQSSTPKIVTCSDDKTYRIWQIPTKWDNSNELQLKHGMAEKLDIQIDIYNPVGHRAPHGAQNSPAKISSVVARQCFTSPLQNIQNISSTTSLVLPYSSPTLNLPNLVIDRLHTPETDKMCAKQNINNSKKMDWLTEFSTKIQRQSCVQHKRAFKLQKSTPGTKRRKLKQCLENNRSASKCLEKFYK